MELKIKLQPQATMIQLKDLILNNSTEPPIEEGVLEVSEDDIEVLSKINNALLEGNISFVDIEHKDFADLLNKAIKKNDKKTKPEKLKKIKISLPKNKVIWATSNNNIILNSFEGKTSLEIDLKNLTPGELNEIKRAINAGQVESSIDELNQLENTETESRKLPDVDTKFEDQDDIFDKFLRFTLDAPLPQFKTLFDKTMKYEHLILFKKMEKSERNRPEYLEVIDKALSLSK